MSSKDHSTHQLATNPEYGDYVKVFVKLAMTALLLHCLAFQFNSPVRIFDRTYMDDADDRGPLRRAFRGGASARSNSRIPS